MKVARGNRTETIPTNTMSELAAASRRPDFMTEVLTIESGGDFEKLRKLLSSLPRPFAVAVLRAR